MLNVLEVKNTGTYVVDTAFILIKIKYIYEEAWTSFSYPLSAI
jgi:hypothetical protein